MKLPSGFKYSAVYAGIRKVKKNDLALIVSDQPAAAAALFTRNRVQASPVRLAKTHLKESGGIVRAILINAGNANCATRTGDRVAATTCRAAAKLLRSPVEQILPASTGVIGVELDAKLITDALPQLADRLSADSFHDVAEAIMTTDTFAKVASAEVALDYGTVNIAGMTKGAGMIQPDMATTLAFITTDAVADARTLRRYLGIAADRSFHCLSVDGDTSTNDTAVLLASGASGVKIGRAGSEAFAGALTHLMQDLAQQIARDGEGAQKRITVEVKGASDEASAVRIARAIANSPLVKTAIAGSDPNWGRILSAAGNSGVEFEPASVDILLQRILVCRSGVAAKFSEEELKRKLDDKECSIQFAISGGGPGQARFFTCDLTEGYIRINASYRT